MAKSIKLQRFIDELKKVYDIFGDIPVALSSDSEGNNYSTMDPTNQFSVTSIAVYKGKLILYPFKEYLDIEEIDS